MTEKKSGLKDLLNKKKVGQADAEGQASAYAENKKKYPPGRYIELSDGRIVKLEETLPNYEKQGASEDVYRNKKGRSRVKRERQLPSTYVCPEWMRRALETNKPLNQRQERYRDNVVNRDDLSKSAPMETVSHNRQGWHRYILWTEMVACKNGFIYYTVPLLISVLFFILTISMHAFWVNALFSLIVLVDFLSLRYAIKKVTKVNEKIFLLLLIIALNVGAYYLASQFPEFLAGLEARFAVRMLLIVFSMWHFGKFYIYFAICYAQDQNLDFGNTVQIKAGKPRCGKTSSAAHDSIILAKLKWQELQYDYWEYVSKEEEIIKSGDFEKLLELHEIKISYNFYIMRPCIPCLWSNIGIFDKQGRAAHKVTLEHVKGLERLPVYSVVVLDEIGAMLKADDGLNRSGVEKPLDVSDMFRLGGHFLKWVVIGCEQDFNHIFIDCRRVVGFNQVIQGQEWVCQPTLILGLYKFLKFLKFDGLDKKVVKSPKYAGFMRKYKKFVYSIGFRRIRYGYAENTQTDAGMVGAGSDSQLVRLDGVRNRLYPSCLAADYDDRAYKAMYPSYFDKEIRGELHKRKYIDVSDKNTANFVNKTDALIEKREAQSDRIKKVS